MNLQIKPINEYAMQVYVADNDIRFSRGDAGYDLFVCEDTIINHIGYTQIRSNI